MSDQSHSTHMEHRSHGEGSIRAPPTNVGESSPPAVGDLVRRMSNVSMEDVEEFQSPAQPDHEKPSHGEPDFKLSSPSDSSNVEKDIHDDSPQQSQGNKTTCRNPPIRSLFIPWHPSVSVPSAADDFWGRIPYPKDPEAGPQPHPEQPPARTSNAATIPSLWEDRGHKFIEGRYHKHLPGKPVNNDPNAPYYDQEDDLVIKLMDMGLDENNQPLRRPTYYVYTNGKPKDWNNKQALRSMNNARRTNIRRITCDPPWTNLEHEYLAELLIEYPNASILELAERFNYRFKGDYKETTAFMKAARIHNGRTLESIRNEYLQYKDRFDNGEVPVLRREEHDRTEKYRKTVLDSVMQKFNVDYSSDDEIKSKILTFVADDSISSNSPMFPSPRIQRQSKMRRRFSLSDPRKNAMISRGPIESRRPTITDVNLTASRQLGGKRKSWMLGRPRVTPENDGTPGKSVKLTNGPVQGVNIETNKGVMDIRSILNPETPEEDAPRDCELPDA